MIFNHFPFPYNELPSTTTTEGRIYHSPVGDLRSVTTILGDHQDKSYLDAWRKAIGKEAAEKESNAATRHGTIIHNLVERYLNNENGIAKSLMPNNKAIFKKLQPLLDIHIKTIYGIEFPVWSSVLRTAGRIDLISSFNDMQIVIADIKTSKEKLSLDQVIERGYFLQTCAYSLMFEERTGVGANNLVIINVPEFEEPVFHIQNRDKYIDQVKRIFVSSGEK